MKKIHAVRIFLLAVCGSALIWSFKAMSEDALLNSVNIDHLLYATSELEKGMDEIEALLGVRPVRGGRHSQYGTHNALLSIGPDIYLEVIARDPDLPEPAGGALVDIPDGAPSRLITWVLRTEQISKTFQAAKSASLGLGPVEAGSREKPDGTVISWQLTDPYAMPLDGALPVLINWGNTVHPASVTPVGGKFVELLVRHPSPDRVREGLSVLGVGEYVKVHEAESFQLSAIIETRTGRKILQ